MELEFEKFGKIPRLNKDCTITEKIDGTNAQIYFDEEGNFLVGSRKREIFPNGTEGKEKSCDNAGFAKWVYDNHEALFEYLGEGRHFGEWAGLGINRGYNLPEKRFYLFNTFRFIREDMPVNLREIGLDVAPILYQGKFSTDIVNTVMEALKEGGSFLSDFDNPEGVIVYHNAAKQYFKVTFEYDAGKWSKQ